MSLIIEQIYEKKILLFVSAWLEITTFFLFARDYRESFVYDRVAVISLALGSYVAYSKTSMDSLTSFYVFNRRYDN